MYDTCRALYYSSSEYESSEYSSAESSAGSPTCAPPEGLVPPLPGGLPFSRARRTASSDDRETMVDVVRRVAEQVAIPFAVGGGLRTVDDARRMLRAGADKIAFNTAAVNRPELLTEAALAFGSQSVVAAIDARRRDADDPSAGWEITIHGGRTPTGIDAVEWCRRVQDLGAGEILLTSMDRDGTKAGFDIDLLRAVTDVVTIPVIASGGAGTGEDMAAGIRDGHASAVLAASIFHFGELRIDAVKATMADEGVTVRRVATA